MTIKTLEEINNAFLVERQAQRRSTRPQPLTPPVTEAGLPETRAETETRRQRSKTPSRGSRGRHVRDKHLKTRRGLWTAVSDMLFSLAMLMVLMVVLTSSSSNGAPKKFFDFAYFTVMTPSMQDEIPQGSFILVRHVDPAALKIGDNITFMADRNVSVTHKILNIYENYNSSGARGFETYGVNNANPDKDIVYEANVVGKVIIILPVAGAMLTSLGENVFIVFIIFGLCVIFSFLIRGVFARPAKTQKAKEAPQMT
jgi:signal peptidase I